MGTATLEASRLNDTRRGLWVWITFFVAVILLSISYGPTASTYKYTYVEPPTATGTLLSERWTHDFFFTATMCFIILAPLTMAYMSDASQKEARRNLHVVVVALLMVYFAVVCVWWTVDASKANFPESTNARNPANDPRYCCVFANSTAHQCYNLACAGVGQGDLVLNAVFLWKYIFVWLYLALLAVDLLVTLCVFKPRVSDFLEPLIRPEEYELVPEAAATTDGAEPSAPPSTVMGVERHIGERLGEKLVAKLVVPRYYHHASSSARMKK